MHSEMHLGVKAPSNCVQQNNEDVLLSAAGHSGHERRRKTKLARCASNGHLRAITNADISFHLAANWSL